MFFANRDYAFNPDADERLNRDLFLDLLHSVITRRGGTYVATAARAGYSYRYLKYLRDKQRPVPPATTVDRIIGALPHVTDPEARALREFAGRAALRRDVPHGSTRLVLDPDQISEELRRLLDDHHRALVTGSTGPDQRGFQEVQQETSRLLARIRRLDADPVTSVRLSILLCHLLNYLDDPGGALKAVRTARDVLEIRAKWVASNDPWQTPLVVEAFRAEAWTFHNICQPRLALDCYDRAEQALSPGIADPQRVDIALGRAAALAGIRRFRIGEVKSLLDEVLRVADQRRGLDEQGALLRLRAQRELAHAYIRHGDLRPRTGRLIREALERIAEVSLAGPLHRVQLYRTAIAYCTARGDLAGRNDFLGRGLAMAKAGGLIHEVRKLEEERDRGILGRAAD